MGNKQFLFYFEFMSVIFCLRRAISWVRRVILSDCFDTVTVVARLYKIKYPRPNKNKREGGFFMSSHAETVSMITGVLDNTRRIMLISIHSRQ